MTYLSISDSGPGLGEIPGSAETLKVVSTALVNSDWDCSNDAGVIVVPRAEGTSTVDDSDPDECVVVSRSDGGPGLGLSDECTEVISSDGVRGNAGGRSDFGPETFFGFLLYRRCPARFNTTFCGLLICVVRVFNSR